MFTLISALSLSGSQISHSYQLNWAGEFVSGLAQCDKFEVSCQPFPSQCEIGTCYLQPLFDDSAQGGTLGHSPRWSPVGAQGYDAQGRANAKEKLVSSNVDRTTQSCTNMSSYIIRNRAVGSIPAQGASCSAGTQEFVGSVAYTNNSCPNGNQNTSYSHRLLPAMDFGLEAAAPGTKGYRSRSLLYDSDTSQLVQKDSCFTIHWF